MKKKYKLFCSSIPEIQWKLFDENYLKEPGEAVFIFFQQDLKKTDHLIFCLNHDEIDKYNSLYFVKDKNNFLLGRFCIKFLISILFHQKCDEIRIEQADFHSKPFLKERENKLFFNISHTSDVVAVAISSFFKLGIDIETVRSNKANELVINTYFTGNEADKIRNSLYPDKLFSHFWTRKEAVIKLLGGHLLEQIKSFDVSEEKFVFMKKLSSNQPENIYLQSFELNNLIQGSVACGKPLNNLYFFRIKQNMLDIWIDKLKSGFTK